jgi:hypothetical protein
VRLKYLKNAGKVNRDNKFKQLILMLVREKAEREYGKKWGAGEFTMG